MSRSDLPLERLVDSARGMTPNWNEVLLRVDRERHARRPLNRRVLALVALALVLLVVGPAVALNQEIGREPSDEPASPPTTIQFADAKRAPKGTFASMDDGAPAGMESRVLAGEARSVPVKAGGRTETLLLAPTKKGGFCLSWSDSGGCWADRAEYVRKGILIGATYGGSPTTTTRLTGAVIAPGTYSVDVIYEDGDRDTVNLVWVSEPINAGFFAHRVPADKRLPGHRVTALVARDREGREIAREDAGQYDD